MTKVGIIFLAVLTLYAASFAQADDCYYHHCDDDGAAGLLTLELFLGGFSTTTLAGNPDENAVYLQNVQDDAANYLAGGEESALLQNAIQSLRNAGKVSGSDLSIAAKLLSSGDSH